MILETARLLLRPPTRKDAAIMADFLTRNKEFFGPWEIERDESYYSSGGQRKRMIMAASAWKAENRFLFLILRKADEKLIGSVHFLNVIRGSFQSCQLSYKLDEDKNNNGYMTEALIPAVKFIFEKQKLHRIEANVMPGNGSSLRILEKLGFEREGVARKYLKINGAWEDHIHMVKLNEPLAP